MFLADIFAMGAVLLQKKTGYSPALLASLLFTVAAAGPVQAASPRAAPLPKALPSVPVAATAPVVGAGIKQVTAVKVVGNERLEADTVRSYVRLQAGDAYDRDILDLALKRLYATDLFADVTIRDQDGVLVVSVRENPVINRIVFEGESALKADKLREEVRLAPRQIYTRAKVRADVGRLIELYRRSGRFAASVEPQVVQLEQNRVDLVFEITEGPKSKVRQINVLGNTHFSDANLRGEMATRQARWWRLFTSNDTYDPDRLAYDREKLRQFYLTEGYADFRVVSAVAELTQDREDFILTYVVEEGPRYKFGEVALESKIRDLKEADFRPLIQIKPGDWYDAKRIEDSIGLLTETAGLFGYAFADIRPRFDRDKDKRLMGVTFVINEAPRVYVERIDVNGNTRTLDKVLRREFRVAEGDAFNSFKVRRSRDRLRSLGYFQENLQIEQKPGSAPDKVVLEANVEERSTGELQVGAGFSSLEQFIADLSIRERNFLGKGQDLRLAFTLSSFRNEVDLGFTEPYFLGRNLAAGFDIYRRDLNSFSRSRVTNDRETTYDEVVTGLTLRTGFPITEYWTLGARYGLSQSEISLGGSFFVPLDPLYPTGAQRCNFTYFVCSELGQETTSLLGYTLTYNSLNNYQRPSKGQRLTFSQDVAGLGGSVKYVRTRLDYDFYYPVAQDWVLRFGTEGGYIKGLGRSVRISDRFFLGGPRIRGFAIRGLGPRDVSQLYDSAGNLTTFRGNESLGGNLFYLSSLELEVPLGAAASEMGLRTSAYVDVGSLWSIDKADILPGFAPVVVGDSWKPRVSVGVGLSWQSPFGPFRIDLARALAKQEDVVGAEKFGDETEVFQFNIGTQF